MIPLEVARLNYQLHSESTMTTKTTTRPKMDVEQWQTFKGLQSDADEALQFECNAVNRLVNAAIMLNRDADSQGVTAQLEELGILLG